MRIYMMSLLLRRKKEEEKGKGNGKGRGKKKEKEMNKEKEKGKKKKGSFQFTDPWFSPDCSTSVRLNDFWFSSVRVLNYLNLPTHINMIILTLMLLFLYVSVLD